MDIDQQEGQTTEELEADMIFMQNLAIGAGGTVRQVRHGSHSSTIGPYLIATPSDRVGGIPVYELKTEESWHGVSCHTVLTFSAETDIEHLIAWLREHLVQKGYFLGTVGRLS
jgi:hypothetical protein